MNFESIRRIYLIGICGTAMTSLAGLLKEKGFEVSGSDANVYPPMSTQLGSLGIQLYSPYNPQNLMRAKPELVIPGNAIPRGNVELEAVLNLRMPYVSMTDALKEFFLRDKQSIVIAGTHGKTTTSSMAAWLLEALGLNPSFLIGGIPLNFDRSFQWNPSGKYFVIEGDEYDTGFMDRRPKFVQYLPEIVLLNPVEFDHADVYADLAAIENAFWQMIKIIPANGTLIVNRDSETAYTLAKRGYSGIVTYGYHPQSMFRISEERWEDGVASFRLDQEEYRIRMFGKHNLANAAATILLAKRLGIKSQQISDALEKFRGVKRRMELRGEVNGISVYDDFAHHPTAIDATLEGARLGFPGSRIWAIFEPRSWSSRRNVFQNEFGKAFRHADEAIIAGVFEPEKLAPEVRLDPEKLAADVRSSGTRASYIPSQTDLIDYVVKNARPGDRLILMSNGSFEGLHEKLLAELTTKAQSH
jgi:UDP-N-acetylmuramate: L-alanyl-gamma-D-glutamyl-meso-diaminopimelate ligase